VALVRLEQISSLSDLVWGAIAGLSGMVGLGFLFRGFAKGRMGIVAPVSAVLAATIPFIVSAFTEGLPRPLQLLGFGIALVSIWLLSRPEKMGGRPAGLGMAVLAGLGFGGFFTALGQVGTSAVFWPLVSGRLSACVVMVAIALSTRRPIIPPLPSLGLLVLAGLLDISGNLFFLLATQTGRLDVAAVLGSLYPAVTTILARLINKEHMTRLQMIGVAIAVLAIVFITV
jgi:drug/metabolite transporter (DMT)-like permease